MGLRRYLRRRWMVQRGGHAVLLGWCPVTWELVQPWLRAGRQVLVVAENEDARRAALQAGAAIVSGRWDDERVLIHSGIAAAHTVACIAGRDTENIDAAVHVARLVAAQRDRSLIPLQLLVHVGDPFLRASVGGQIDQFAAREVVQWKLFSTAQIAVRRLLRDAPLHFWRVPSQPVASLVCCTDEETLPRQGQSAPHSSPCQQCAADVDTQPTLQDSERYQAPRLWIVGTTPLAEELAVATLRQARYPSLALVGRDAEEFRASFLARWPGACAVANMVFLSAPAELGEAGLSHLLSLLPNPTGIHFCHEDDGVNLAASLTVQRAFVQANFPLPPLYLHCVHPGKQALRGALGMHPWFLHFGTAAEVAQEILMGEQLDAVAERIHERYVNDSLARGDALGSRRSLQHWPLLAEDLKDDNRWAADHHFIKVQDLRLALVPRQEVPGTFQWNAAQVEALSRTEHDRWMVQRLLTGWQYAAERDDARKQHPDIVPWEELPENRRELDREVVRQMPELFAQMGWALCRCQYLLVRGPRTPWAFPEAFDHAIDTILATACTAPPQAVVLWLGADSALAWRVAERMQAAKRGRIGLILTEPLDGYLRGLPDDPTRARVLTLLRQASGVLYLPDRRDAMPALQPDRVLQLSIDGSDLPTQGFDWAVDAAGRVLRRPPHEAAP